MFSFKNLFALVLAAAALCACSAMPSGSGGNDDVGAAAERLRLAMIEPDAAKLDALVAEGLNYGHSSGRVDTKASFIGDLMSGASDFVTIGITEQTVKVSDNVGVIRHVLTATTNDSGKPGAVKLNVLQVWQRQGGAWKLLARQAVRVS